MRFFFIVHANLSLLLDKRSAYEERRFTRKIRWLAAAEGETAEEREENGARPVNWDT